MVNLLALRNLRQIQSTRTFWGWLNMITNKVDDSRIKDVGPDRAAAEWLLRCGAGVRWKDKEAILTDYNSLPPGGYRSLYIEEIDASGSCIMSVGFPHFRGLKHLKKLILHKCNYLDNEALPMLAAVKDSLEELQLSSCGDIDDSGVKSLSCLTNLGHLLLYDLPEVRNKEGCVQFLHSALPCCDIEFPYASASETKKD
ncbi:ATP synthase subunit s, mitochondrial-like [Daphnia carinata]|uniref:ATP synthase subunit s, mitochondrial-like n=1 Tax=Daphnia carinata TaxID=120202 RepID=UPI0025795CB3|nr:ATP synthase subunit s, mitochondrial-like [Daphnia carinata]